MQGCRKPRSDLTHFADHLLRFASPTRTNTRTKALEHVIHDAKKEKKVSVPLSTLHYNTTDTRELEEKDR